MWVIDELACCNTNHGKWAMACSIAAIAAVSIASIPAVGMFGRIMFGIKDMKVLIKIDWQTGMAAVL